MSPTSAFDVIASEYSSYTSSAFGAAFDLPLLENFLQLRVEVITRALANMSEFTTFRADRTIALWACYPCSYAGF
jgi:hypothetical protein